MSKTISEAPSGQVWDVFLRLFHWLLVVTLGVSWLTAELGVEYREYHFYSGYFAFGLVVFRLLWGIWGTSYARFSQFLKGPAAVIAYVRGRFSDATPPERYPGHSPLGALAVIALLGFVSVQTVTGLFADDDILYAGPWREAITSATANDLTGWHHTNFNLLLGMVVVHLLAIGLYRWRFDERLTSAMLHGRKARVLFGDFQPLRAVPWISGFIAIGLAIASVWLMLELAPEPVYDDYY